LRGKGEKKLERLEGVWIDGMQEKDDDDGDDDKEGGRWYKQ
jgi:hypothetical protein